MIALSRVGRRLHLAQKRVHFLGIESPARPHAAMAGERRGDVIEPLLERIRGVGFGQLIGDVAEAGRIRVFIGHENQPIEMRDVSLVLAPYGRPGQAIGVVGVLGPTRMSYSQAIGTVRFVSGLMNELVDHLYA